MKSLHPTPHCTTLHHTALHYTTLHCTAPYKLGSNGWKGGYFGGNLTNVVFNKPWFLKKFAKKLSIRQTMNLSMFWGVFSLNWPHGWFSLSVMLSVCVYVYPPSGIKTYGIKVFSLRCSTMMLRHNMILYSTILHYLTQQYTIATLHHSEKKCKLRFILPYKSDCHPIFGIA